MTISSECPNLPPALADFLATQSSELPIGGFNAEDLRSGPRPLDGLGTQIGQHLASQDVTVPVRDGQIVIRIFRPDTPDNLQPIVFLHGGCWVFCDLDSHDDVCRHLCVKSGHPVVSIGYRLAPEFPFPTGLRDAYDACLWLQKNGADYQLDPSAFVVVGDSAGGNLSAALCLLNQEQKQLPLVGQALIYPITDVRPPQTESAKRYARGYFLTEDLMNWTKAQYLNGADPNNPLISPLAAENLGGLPPALILTAEYDLLRDEGEAYAAALVNAGVATTLRRFDGMIHAFVAMAGLLPEGAQALDQCAAFAKETFCDNAPQ